MFRQPLSNASLIVVVSLLALFSLIDASMSCPPPRIMPLKVVGQPQRQHKARQQRQAVEWRVLLLLAVQVLPNISTPLIELTYSERCGTLCAKWLLHT